MNVIGLREQREKEPLDRTEPAELTRKKKNIYLSIADEFFKILYFPLSL